MSNKRKLPTKVQLREYILHRYNLRVEEIKDKMFKVSNYEDYVKSYTDNTDMNLSYDMIKKIDTLYGSLSRKIDTYIKDNNLEFMGGNSFVGDYEFILNEENNTIEDYLELKFKELINRMIYIPEKDEILEGSISIYLYNVRGYISDNALEEIKIFANRITRTTKDSLLLIKNEKASVSTKILIDSGVIVTEDFYRFLDERFPEKIPTKVKSVSYKDFIKDDELKSVSMLENVMNSSFKERLKGV